MTTDATTHPYGDTLRLHLGSTSRSDVHERWGDYDFTYYPTSRIAIAFLGWHPVAVFDCERMQIMVGADVSSRLVNWAIGCDATGDNDTVVLTEHGRAAANPRAPQRGADGAANPV